MSVRLLHPRCRVFRQYGVDLTAMRGVEKGNMLDLIHEYLSCIVKSK